MISKIYLSPDKVLPGSWRVDAFDSNGGASVAVTVFAGFDAKRFAAEYAGQLRFRLQQRAKAGCQAGQRPFVMVRGQGQRSTGNPLAIR